ncbi:MAG: hypothetical protein JSS02_29595 [Planctomycetes bacterium]|nr:hypothetical protein [Planctomycetota bacterium]
MAVLLAVGWSVLLLLLDLFTAGRSVVGPAPIQKADVVVVGRRVDGQSNRIQVDRVFKGEVAAGDTLRVIDLADAQDLKPETAYVFALKHHQSDFEFVRMDLPRTDLPLPFYPATSATIEQTKIILRDAAAEAVPGGRP